MSSRVFVTKAGVTWHPTSRAIAERIAADLSQRLSVYGMELHGMGPVFVDSVGTIFNVGNVVQRCLADPRRTVEILDVFVSNVGALASVEDLLAVSADVARASFRLRIREAATVNGWPVEGHCEETDSVLGEIEASIVRRPGFPGTDWLLYLQRPGAAQSVATCHLEQWGVEPEEAWTAARAAADRVPRGMRSRRYGVWRDSDDSMFHHTRLLRPESIEPKTSQGWFVGAPTRSDVLVARAQTGDRGLRALTHTMQSIRELWSDDGCSGARHCWFVSANGPGRWGEDAEPVLLIDDSAPGSPICEMTARFGDRTHALFGEYMPKRPAPRLVL